MPCGLWPRWIPLGPGLGPRGSHVSPVPVTLTLRSMPCAGHGRDGSWKGDAGRAKQAWRGYQMCPRRWGTAECLQRFPATPRSKAPAAPKQLFLQNCGAESPPGEGDAKAARASGHDDVRSSPGWKNSRSGWGEASQKVKALLEPRERLEAELCFVNSRSPAQPERNKSEPGVFGRRRDQCGARSGVSARPGAARCQPPRPGQQGAGRSCPRLGRGWRCAHRPAVAQGKPPRMEDQSLALGLSPPARHRRGSQPPVTVTVTVTNGRLCFTAAKRKERPQKSPQVSRKQGMGGGGKKILAQGAEVIPWASVPQLGLGSAMGSASRLGFGGPGFHPLVLGKDHGDIQVLSAGKDSWS